MFWKILVLSLVASIASFSNDEIYLGETHIGEKGFQNSVSIREMKNTILISKEKIREKKYRNIEDILKDVPGVHIQNTAFGPVVDMRASGEGAVGRVKVLVDGISINSTDGSMSSVPINTIPVEAIEKIEVIPGGRGVVYGSGTVGGVINISTVSNKDSNNFYLDMNYASFENRSLGFSGGYNVDPSDDFYLNYAFNYSNSYGYRDEDLREEKGGLVGLDYSFNSKHRVRLQLRHFLINNNTSSEVTKYELASNRRKKGLDFNINEKNYSGTFEYEYKPKENFLITSALYMQKDKKNLEAQSIDDVVIEFKDKKDIAYEDDIYRFDNVISNMKGVFKEDKNGINLKSKYIYDKGELLFGYEYDIASLDREANVISNELKTYRTENGKEKKILNKTAMKHLIKINMKQKKHSLYLLNNYNFTDKFNMTFGYRREWVKYKGERKNGPNIVPLMNAEPTIKNFRTDRSLTANVGELGLAYKYNELGNIYFKYERSFVAPFTSQLTDKVGKENELYHLNVATEYVNNNLKAEKIDTFEVGMKDYIYEIPVKLSFFLSDTKDEIISLHTGITNPATKKWQFKNLAKTRRYGLELETEQNIGKFNFSEALTYTKGKVIDGNPKAQVEKGDKIPLNPKVKLRLGAKYNFTDYLNIGLTYTYLGSQEQREMTAKDKSFRLNRKGYGLVDLNMNFKFDDYMTFRAGIKNLTSVKYNLRETSIMATPAPKATYYAGFNLKF